MYWFHLLLLLLSMLLVNYYNYCQSSYSLLFTFPLWWCCFANWCCLLSAPCANDDDDVPFFLKKLFVYLYENKKVNIFFSAKKNISFYFYI